MSLLPVLALVAGAAIAVQAGLNAQLGVQLRHVLLGTTIAFGVAAGVSLLASLALPRSWPGADTLQAVPGHLWFGGALSALGVGLFYFLIPRMGVGPMMSFALTGQLAVALIVSHYGWFELPVRPLTPIKLLGAVALVAGVILINRE